MDNLSVLLVTPDYPPPPGGIQTIVRNLERGLDEAGHRVEVLHVNPEGYDTRPSDYLPTPRWLYSLGATLTGQFRYLNAVERESKRAINRVDPDVVHAMHVRCWPALAVARKHDIPTALSTYALELGEQNLAANAIADADTVHAISEYTASLVRDVAATDPDISLVPPSIDVDSYQTIANEVESDGSVVTLARFVDRKNIETVVRAWDQLPSEVTENRRLVVAGDGPNRTKLERIARDNASIEFPGWVNGEGKRRLLAGADAFVMVPRRNGYDVEGFGIVYIEAQAAGTPVVGSKHGGAPEAIGDAGIVVDDENDPTEVASAIETLLTDKAVRAECLEASDERIDRFGIPAVTEDHLQMYRYILEQR